MGKQKGFYTRNVLSPNFTEGRIERYGLVVEPRKTRRRKRAYRVVRERASTQYFDALYNQTGVAEAEKTVLILHRIFVNVKDFFPSRQASYEHNERTFWQMEICDKTLYRTEFIPGINENVGITGAFS